MASESSKFAGYAQWRSEESRVLLNGVGNSSGHRSSAEFRLCRQVNARKALVMLVLMSVITILCYAHYVINSPFTSLIHRDTVPTPLVQCRLGPTKNDYQQSDHRSEARLRIDPKVLVFVETTYTQLGRDIAELLVHTRIKYKLEVSGKSLPVLTNLDKGRYGVIVFENIEKYFTMDKWNRELLDKYCREYSVGIIGFMKPSEETLVGAQLQGFPLFIHTNLRLQDAALNPKSPILRMVRSGETAWGTLPGED